MNRQTARGRRRRVIFINYAGLLIVNVTFYCVFQWKNSSHIIDAAGLLALAAVAVTFRYGHIKTGLWKLTHTHADKLDERELQLTHYALRHAYGWFSIICLSIMLIYAMTYRLIPEIKFIITVPLAVSLIYFAHTLPGSILAWTEKEVPGDAL
ncbi:MAG: hypothetical protein GXO69_08975 [Acidobacteria bacterium]|nr:hypothetical protein [Acidobacteriota bacterium]